MIKNNFCIGCNSNESSNCLKANQTMEKRCGTNLCFSRLIRNENKVGMRVERGCLEDLSEECDEANGCQVCEGKRIYFDGVHLKIESITKIYEKC